MEKRAEVAFPCNPLQRIRLEGWSLRLTSCFKFLEMEYEVHEM